MHIFTSRPRVFVIVGLPGSGKSTWAKTFFHPSTIVSSDAIRQEKWPNEPYQADRNEETFAEFHRRVGGKLEEGQDVVADTTGLYQQFRRELADVAGYHDAEKHLIFFNNPSQAIYRNAQRTGDDRVPDDAMKGMLELYREVRPAILNEPYASITIIEGTS